MRDEKAPDAVRSAAQDAGADPEGADAGGEITVRLKAERAHGAAIMANASEVWGWSSTSGRRRFSRRARMLADAMKRSRTVLEYGVGTGDFSRVLAPLAPRYVVIDVSHDLLLKGREDGAFLHAHIVEGDLHRLPFRPGVFDHVHGSSVLHHLEADKALGEAWRVLRNSGSIAFSEPNFSNPQIAVVKRSKWLKERVGDTPHETAFYRGQMYRLLRAAGFAGISVTFYDFLYPLIPDSLLNLAEKLGRAVERTPGLRSIAGSLWITAIK